MEKEIDQNGLLILARAMLHQAVRDARNQDDLTLRNEARWWLYYHGARMAEVLWPARNIPAYWRERPTAAYQPEISEAIE